MERAHMHSDTYKATRLAYGINDALAVVPVGRSLLYAEIKAGALKTFKIGIRTLIGSEDLSSWLETYRRVSTRNEVPRLSSPN